MAEQLHYASVPTGASGRAGFQFTARSGPIPPQTERLVERFMTYRPPPGTRPTEQCPVSLAYDRTPWGAIVACCRYLGTDYTGRPGNFLGHAVLMSLAELDGLRPIELWRAPFWARTPAASLAPVYGLRPGQAVDPERVVELLAAGGGHGVGLLAALLDASRDALAGRAGPVTLVSDDVDRIALWIAAVSYSLPVPVTRDLSFVTYTADPRAAHHHLVGTTATGSTGMPDGAVYRVDLPHSDVLWPPPSPYATAVAAAWRRRDLVELDTLCAIGATGLTVVPGGTARGGGLDAAATLLAVCRARSAGGGQVAAGRSNAFRLLESLSDKDRVRLADAAAASLAVAAPADVEALLTGDDGVRVGRLLSQRDWSDAPHVGRLLRSAEQRRDRRDTNLRPDLGGSPDVAGRCAALVEEVGLRRALDDPVVREECARALTTAPTTAPTTDDVGDPAGLRPGWWRLARAIADGCDEPPVGLADTVADPADAPREGTDPLGLVAASRMLLGAAAVVHGCTAGAGAERLAGEADLLARWHPSAEPGLAQRALRQASRALGELPPLDRAELLRHATPVTRNLLVTDWLAYLPDDERVQVDLAELGIRLRSQEVTVEPLVAYLTALAARPLVLRRVYRGLRGRDPRLADGLRRVVREAVADWRGLVLGPAGESR